MPDVTYNQDVYDQYPAENDPDSSLPLELDAAPVTGESIHTDKAASIADRLRSDLATPAVVPTHDVPVPGRHGWALRFRLDWNEAKTEKWRRQAKDKSFEEGYSKEKLSTALLADQCVAILIDDEVVTVQGERWTFASKAFQREVGVGTASQAVRKVIPMFSHLVDVAEQVSTEARQGDILDPI